ncbi:MAG: PP2C family protein-serine/threonine phosphatase [Deltaproteobacteria bacterium]
MQAGNTARRDASRPRGLGLTKETIDLLPCARRLSFPAEVERRFQADYARRTVGTSRIALGIGIFLYAVFGILDYWGLPLSTAYAWAIRYAIVCPFFSAVLVASWIPAFRKMMQPLLSTAVCVAGLGIVAMIVVAKPAEPAHSHYYAGLILVVMFGFTFVQLRLRYAILATSLVVVAYETGTLVIDGILNSPDGASLFLNSNFFFVSAHVLGISACYTLEFYKRRDFLQRRVIESDLIAARDVQHALIPKRFPDIPGLSVAGSCRTSRAVGGDYFDVLQRGAAEWLLVIADISGKGTAAALLMANLQAIIRTQAPGMTLQEIASLVNRHVHRFTNQGRYITAILASYNASTGMLAYLNAGHNGGAVVGADGSVRRLRSTGFPLGMFPQAWWEVDDVALAAGSKLLLYTDGIVEREDARGDFYGDGRLFRMALRNPGCPSETALNAILDDCDSFAGSAPMSDDSTLLLAAIPGAYGPSVCSETNTRHAERDVPYEQSDADPPLQFAPNTSTTRSRHARLWSAKEWRRARPRGPAQRSCAPARPHDAVC